jgi:hypothetical protein
MLLNELDKDSKIKDRTARNICSCATFRKVLSGGGGEVIFCGSAKGVSAPEKVRADIGYVWMGEICKATEFFRRGDGEYKGCVNLEDMKDCPYRRTE